MEIVATIILNYNSSTDCRKCVSFLKKQRGVKLEIVVVDNCSRADEVEQLRRLCKEQGCTLIENHENRGYNAGNNIGLRYAAEKGYKYAMIANPDMEFPQEDYMARVVAKMDEDLKIAVLGTSIVDAKGLQQNPLDFVSFWSEFLWPMEMLKYKRSHKSLSTVMDYTRSGYCPIVSGCCFCIRMSFVKQIGYFDENVFLYCEEPILAHQVKKSGMKEYYMSEVMAIHRHISSTKGNTYARMILLCKSRDYKNKYHSNYNAFQVLLLRISSDLRKAIMKIKS